MQVQPALRVEEYDASDTDAVERARRVLEAARRVDTPFLPPVTLFRHTMEVRYGWDLSPVRHLLMHVDGEPVAVGDVEVGEWDNRDVAWIGVVVDPAVRRRGFGSALLAEAVDLGRRLGRTKFGGDGWETPGIEPFARRHGFRLGSTARYSLAFPRELPPEQLEAILIEAAGHAGDYELVRIAGPAPEQLLSVLADLTSAINDAPLDDLDVEDEVFPVERILDYQKAVIEGGHRLYRVIARHRVTGEPAGHTIVAVDTETPALGYQHDTAVVRAHRGHRLGLLLKADMRQWLAAEEPQLESIDTFNAESNAHMLAVNERLGYRAIGRAFEFQRPND